MKSMKNNRIHIAALGDIHQGKYKFSESIIRVIEKSSDLLLIAGDLTSRGLIGQAKECLALFRSLSIPVIAVLGNHDYDNDKELEIIQLFEQAGISLLRGGVATAFVNGLKIGVTGTKGHGGGFAPHRGYARGEKSTKLYMQEEEQEVKKFSDGLSKMHEMDLDIRIALLHYSPYIETIFGEPPELSLFMGSSRFADEIEKYPVNLVVHGHAHHGTGRLIKTRKGAFACNVAQMLHKEKYALFSIDKAFSNDPIKVQLLTGQSN